MYNKKRYTKKRTQYGSTEVYDSQRNTWVNYNFLTYSDQADCDSLSDSSSSGYDNSSSSSSSSYDSSSSYSSSSSSDSGGSFD